MIAAVGRISCCGNEQNL